MKEKNVNYLEKDDLGSTRKVVSTGVVVTSYYYDAFGNIMESSISEDISYQYTGQEFDEETGLHNFQARFYDSVLMRFYAVDPEEQFASPYLYCGNNPILYIDPDGEAAKALEWANENIRDLETSKLEWGLNQDGTWDGKHMYCNLALHLAFKFGEGFSTFPVSNFEQVRNYWEPRDALTKEDRTLLSKDGTAIYLSRNGGTTWGHSGMAYDAKLVDGKVVFKFWDAGCSKTKSGMKSKLFTIKKLLIEYKANDYLIATEGKTAIKEEYLYNFSSSLDPADQYNDVIEGYQDERGEYHYND